MRVAVIGAGISGMVAAYRLSRDCDVTVFEAGQQFGGHTYTVDVEVAGRPYAVDMGFIVFNDWTYPRFIELLGELGVESQPSNMSFSVSCERSGLEYNGTSLNSLFAQRRNLVNPVFLRMIADILRFNKSARAMLRDARLRMHASCRPGEAAAEGTGGTPGAGDQAAPLTLGEYLTRHHYSRAFMDYYLVPMGRAIWSATEAAILACPLTFFVDFFDRHGFLNIDNRPQWRVVKGGSREYARKLTAPYRSRIRLRTPVTGVRRQPDTVVVRTVRGDVERFDAVVFACHSDQALRMLDPPSPLEQEILGAIPYQENEAILHTDVRMLPRARLAGAAWNYHRLQTESERVAVTYNMNVLQTLTAPEVFMVTLNRGRDISPGRVLHRAVFDHPVYTPAAVAAQGRRSEISGQNRSYFCGAYWRNGFHEDGCISGEWAAEELLKSTHSRDRLVCALEGGRA